MDVFIKVDRVQSATEAEALAKLGVHCIGLDFRSTPLFVDNRQFVQEQAQALCSQFPDIQISAHLSDPLGDSESWIELIKRCSFDYVEISSWNLPPRSFRRQLIDQEIGVIYSHIDVSSDTDPTWILSRFEEEEDLGVAYFQLELLSDIENSWSFLKEECPKFPEEIQISDIEDLAARHSILLSLDYSSENVGDVLRRVKNIRGLAFTLGDIAEDRYDVHAVGFEQLIAVLKALKSIVDSR